MIASGRVEDEGLTQKWLLGSKECDHIANDLTNLSERK